MSTSLNPSCCPMFCFVSKAVVCVGEMCEWDGDGKNY